MLLLYFSLHLELLAAVVFSVPHLQVRADCSEAVNLSALRRHPAAVSASEALHLEVRCLEIQASL